MGRPPARRAYASERGRPGVRYFFSLREPHFFLIFPDRRFVPSPFRRSFSSRKRASKSPGRLNLNPALILLEILSLLKNLLVNFIPVHRGIAVLGQKNDQPSSRPVQDPGLCGVQGLEDAFDNIDRTRSKSKKSFDYNIVGLYVDVRYK